MKDDLEINKPQKINCHTVPYECPGCSGHLEFEATFYGTGHYSNDAYHEMSRQSSVDYCENCNRSFRVSTFLTVTVDALIDADDGSVAKNNG